MLEVKGLSKSFGGLAAVANVSFHIGKGEIVGLIGPNGAGKTTVFNLISGIHRPLKGKILFQGNDITSANSASTSRMGIARTFQSPLLFGELSVRDNIQVALRDGRTVEEILRFFGLEWVENEVPNNLPHGYQRLLGIAIAIATKPSMLMLDEPLTGMNPSEAEKACQIIKAINTEDYYFAG
ncbi:ATP-binding cassette domain-containing protein [Metallumcola ferriviriculae]|uniref:ATP-binding cassette domain-containing protein n=1 Tax=Metallumcola ferriviriculae TaxID=3039180 RepID=A0AAU0UQU8_9FIRM|nr:ATP-binding cassette domain-containing protein [Desulfitibacteraceae bacterium MK1]